MTKFKLFLNHINILWNTANYRIDIFGTIQVDKFNEILFANFYKNLFFRSKILLKLRFSMSFLLQYLFVDLLTEINSENINFQICF